MQPLMISFLLQQTLSLNAAQRELLAHRRLFAVSQLMDVDILTGRLTTDENRARSHRRFMGLTTGF